MKARYDDVIVALMNNELDRAIALIQTIQEERKASLIEKRHEEIFELTPNTYETARSTDFLHFHGWEAA